MSFAAPLELSSTQFTYLVTLGACGALMLLIAAVGFGASVTPRLFSGALGLVFLGYGVWVAFIRPKEDVFAMYPVGFILPILVIGFVLYSRVSNREIDAELAAERAKRIAARQAAARATEADPGSGSGAAT